MRNYFIAGLGNQSLESICRAGILYSDFDCDGARGILINDAQLEEILRVLNMSVFREDTTRFDGVYLLTLSPTSATPSTPPTELQVQYDGWGEALGDRSGFMRALENILLPVVLKKIILHGNGGSPKRPRSGDGIFRVMIWAGAYSEKGSGDFSEKVWGYVLPCSAVWFSPSGDGFTIKIPENEAAIAELIGDNLYILAPVAHSQFKNGLAIFRRILEEVAAELSLSPEQRAERDRQRAEAERVQIEREHVETRVKYIELCKQRIQQVVEDAKKRVLESGIALEETQASIVTTHRELAGSRKKLEQLRQIKTAEDQRFAEEFEKICAIPQVEEVVMRDSKTLQVTTSVLTCQDPGNGTVHELGKFRIEIPVNGGNVRWFNLTRRVDGLETGMHSPVVDANGYTILINAIQAFPELIANYEIATAVQLALQVPGSIDPSEEHAKHLSGWPTVSAA